VNALATIVVAWLVPTLATLAAVIAQGQDFGKPEELENWSNGLAHADAPTR